MEEKIKAHHAAGKEDSLIIFSLKQSKMNQVKGYGCF